MNNKFTFFWNGVFSQWAKTLFMDVEEIVYCTAEQYMMAHKALLFKDQETYVKIMSTTDPEEQKALGRTVKNFNQKIWNVMSSLIVYDGNLLKFSQNQNSKNALLATRGTILVEASPFDTIWGIGLKQDDPLSKNIETWKGENRLGFILTKVRETIIAESK